MRKNSYNKYTLPEKYPHLATAMETVFKENRQKTMSAYIQYSGNPTATGAPRKLELGAIIDTLEDYGYKVEINIKKIKPATRETARGQEKQLLEPGK